MKKLLLPILFGIFLTLGWHSSVQAIQPPPQLGINPDPVDFGEVCDPDSALDVKLTGKDIFINSITLTGADAAEFSITNDPCTGNAIPAPGCTIEVTFTPASFGTKTASLVINQTGDADGDGDIAFDVTGIGAGCGDGEVNCSETCDFANSDDVDCCDETCTPVNDGLDCNAAGGCKTGGTCNSGPGTCENTSDEPDGTACSNGDTCIENETCLTGECQGGIGVVCPIPAECFESSGCDPVLGCLETPAAAGTSCDSGNGTCDGSGNCEANPVPPSDSGSCSLSMAAADGSSLYFSLLMGSVAVMGLFRRFRHR